MARRHRTPSAAEVGAVVAQETAHILALEAIHDARSAVRETEAQATAVITAARTPEMPGALTHRVLTDLAGHNSIEGDSHGRT
ncbi:hypothetical protein [Aromatoleum buckelii]|uniref:Uncharacterized protein n=1 Tax=Aromatoleum buckelii TaxID=200254 RepID=A0ABX1N7J3_9RHOO|nr:hypothetical protein [Aromatoleum buckelii]MCK0511946.1 hypothetical protein [Aromatoleum buckelii]